jgi:hypothetical protein
MKLIFHTWQKDWISNYFQENISHIILYLQISFVAFTLICHFHVAPVRSKFTVLNVYT